VSKDEGIKEPLAEQHTKDDRVTTEEHLGDEAVAVDGLGLLDALASAGCLSPHLIRRRV
jgi:hypothetical protein